MISAPILPHAITLHFAIRLNTNVSHPNHICISWHHSADDTKDLKEKLKNKDAEIATLNRRVKEAEARVKQVEVELAASVSKIEISCEAAVGQAKVLIAQQCQEAYKEGVRDTKTLFKEMRSMF